ncbi:hypothetical protein ES703_47397 [subsurface metagenome]
MKIQKTPYEKYKGYILNINIEDNTIILITIMNIKKKFENKYLNKNKGIKEQKFK